MTARDQAAPLTKWLRHPNLRKRPPAPSKGRGPVQVRIRRAFVASGGGALTSSAIYDWTHLRRRGRRKSMPFGIYSMTLRTLRTMCDPIERASTIGRPWIWRLREPVGSAVGTNEPRAANKSLSEKEK
jgi:hypothetical protein